MTSLVSWVLGFCSWILFIGWVCLVTNTGMQTGGYVGGAPDVLVGSLE